MKNYNTIANTSGSFPNVVSQNASGAGATDGTPYIAQFIDDLWGARQALMNNGAQTPDGTDESSSASQNYTAMQRCFGQPGEIIWYGGNILLSLFDEVRLLPMYGQELLIADYADLAEACYVGDSANPTAPAFYKTNGSGTRSTSGTHIKLPDARGYFLRAADSTGLVDVDRSGITSPGDTQADGVIDHIHYVKDESGGPADGAWASWIGEYYICTTNPGVGAAVQKSVVGFSSGASQLRAHDVISPTPTTDTRPKNMCLHCCIRY